MRQWAVAMLAAGGIALGLAPVAWAPTGAASLGVSASFDRTTIARGQVAVATVELQNRGPDPATGVVVEATVDSAQIVRATGSSGSCAKRSPTVVRCAFAGLGFGSGPSVTIHVRPSPGARSIHVTARIVRTATDDVTARDNVAGAAVRVASGEAPPSLNETSFTFTCPAEATVGMRFTAMLRLLNRGPRPIDAPSVRIAVRPGARVLLSALPRRLGVGEERTVRVAITPQAAGRLAIDVLVGASGRGRTTVRVSA